MKHKKDRIWSDDINYLFSNGISLKENQHNVINITFQVTDNCNLACTYCYQINKQTHSMSFDIAKQFIDLLIDNELQYIYDTKNSLGVIIEFIGGEPLLEIDLIDQICDYFVQQLIINDHPWAYHYRFSICSNGTLYFTPKVQAFMKKHRHDLSFAVTIDGNKELHDKCRIFPDGSGSYDIAHAAAEHYMKTNDVSLGTKMTLAPENIKYTYQAVLGLINDGYEHINLNCVFEEGWTIEHARILYQELKKISDYIFENNLFDTHSLSIFDEMSFQPLAEDDNQNWCGGTGSMLSIDYKGDLYPCIRYMESSIGDDQPPYIIGKVAKNSVSINKESFDCLKCITRRSQSTDACFYCPIAQGCAWCSGYNYQIFGTADKRATFICEMHQARALANAYFWNKGYILSGSNKRFKIWLPDEYALQIIDEEELEMLKILETFPVNGLDNNKEED